MIRSVASSEDELRQRGRWLKWTLWVFGCVFGVLVLFAFTLVVLLHSLDQPWVKRRLQAFARASAGIDIDYTDARINVISGALVEGLVVQSPLEVRLFAPDLVRVGRLEVDWSPTAMFSRRRPLVARVAVSDVTITTVIDENGRTSFDALPSSSAPSPTVPLSRRASRLLATPPPVAQLDVDHVTLALVRTDHRNVSERAALQGVSVRLVTSSAEPIVPGWRIDVGLGSRDAPLELSLVRHAGANESMARARLWGTLGATSSALTAALDLRMIEQTFSQALAADHWLRADMSFRFDPNAGRTEAHVDRIEAGDGAVTAQASIDIFDAADPVVRHAQGDIDLARLVRWLPPGLVPVTAERARLRFELDSLVAGWPMRLSAGSALTANAEIANVALGGPFGSLRVAQGALSLHLQPAVAGGTTAMGAAAAGGVAAGGVAAGAVSADGSAKISGLGLTTGDDHFAVEDLSVDFDGEQRADSALGGRAGVRFAKVERGGGFVARDGHVELRMEGLRADVSEPLATQGDLALAFDLASLDGRFPAVRVIAEGVKVRAHTHLDGHPPYAVELDAPASRLRLIGPDGRLFADAPAHVEIRARDVQPDAVHPAASRAAIAATVALGDTGASLDATKRDDAIDFLLHATARSLNVLRPFLPPALADRAPWDRIAVEVRSSGHAEHLMAKSPFLSQITAIDIDHPAFDGVTAQSLSLTVKSRGNALHHQADVDLRAQALAFEGGGSPRDDHLALSATVDGDRPSLEFRLATDGRATSKLAGLVSFDRSRRALSYDVDANLAGLAPLAPLAAKIRGLDGFDWSELEVGLSARGALLGVVAGVAQDGTIRFESNPARTAAAEGTTDLRLAHFRWSKGDMVLSTPALAWHGDLRSVGSRRTLESRLEVGSLHLDLGARDVDMNGISDEATAAVIGDLTDPAIELTQRLSVHAVEQTVVPEYPIGDIAFGLSAERGPEGVVHVSDLKLENGLGGTTLAVTGNVDLGDARRTLSVTTSLTQDLARFSTVPERFKGKGTVAVEANVVSPDFSHYQVRSTVKADDVSLMLSRAGIEVEAANGEVPITVALELGAHGVALQRSQKGSPYSMLRFADQHPLLSRSGFFSITRLKTPFVSIAPLVGNLEIEQNVVSLRQFEMGVRGGTITGQCGLDWKGSKSTLEIHVRASGVQSSHGEPFDGNIAVAVSAADHTIDGRAEILRIGERHLLDLLDLYDPAHADPATNRIRTALRFGYPDNVRLVFDHGFASAHVQLGGLARLVSVGDLRGIPMGPIVDSMLAPLFGRDVKETE